MCFVTRKPCGPPAASRSRCVSAIPAAETSHIATLQPSATSWQTSSRPIPEPPPVTTAILPAKSLIVRASLDLVLGQADYFIRCDIIKVTLIDNGGNVKSGCRGPYLDNLW